MLENLRWENKRVRWTGMSGKQPSFPLRTGFWYLLARGALKFVHCKTFPIRQKGLSRLAVIVTRYANNGCKAIPYCKEEQFERYSCHTICSKFRFLVRQKPIPDALNL